MSCKMKTMLFVGICLVIGCIAFTLLLSTVVNMKLNEKLVLKPGSDFLSRFKKPPVAIYFDYYFFNVTNPDEIRLHGKKPIVNEIGPYRYRYEVHRENLAFDDAKGTVEYEQRNYYFFERSQSVGAENDSVTLLNPLLTVAAWHLSQNDSFRRIIWPQLESNMALFEEYKVGEFLFSGFDLPKLLYLDFSFMTGKEWTKGLVGTAYEIMTKLGRDAPDLIKENKFGLYYKKNGSISGVFNVNTGEKNIEKYLNIRTFNKEPQVNYWKSNYCNMLNGTDGTQFAPQKDEIPKRLEIFNVDLCRSLYVEFEKTDMLHDILETRRYSLPKELLQSPENNPDNACFCHPLPGETRCLNDSMINAAPCKMWLPIILSTPHFYMGSQYDINNVIGLNPKKSLHETYVQVEPKTGVVVDAAKRMQVNVPLKPFADMPAFKNVPELIFPLIWAAQSAQVSEEKAQTLHSKLTKPFIFGYPLFGGLIFIGLLLAGVANYKLKAQKMSKPFTSK